MIRLNIITIEPSVNQPYHSKTPTLIPVKNKDKRTGKERTPQKERKFTISSHYLRKGFRKDLQ